MYSRPLWADPSITQHTAQPTSRTPLSVANLEQFLFMGAGCTITGSGGAKLGVADFYATLNAKGSRPKPHIYTHANMYTHYTYRPAHKPSRYQPCTTLAVYGWCYCNSAISGGCYADADTVRQHEGRQIDAVRLWSLPSTLRHRPPQSLITWYLSTHARATMMQHCLHW